MRTFVAAVSVILDMRSCTWAPPLASSCAADLTLHVTYYGRGKVLDALLAEEGTVLAEVFLGATLCVTAHVPGGRLETTTTSSTRGPAPGI